MNNYCFAIYHSYYKHKFVSYLTWAFIYAINNFYLLFNCDNFLIAFLFFASNCNTYIAQLSLVVRKKELLKIFSSYIINTLMKKVKKAETWSFLLSLTFSKMYLATSKYAIIFKWQFV